MAEALRLAEDMERPMYPHYNPQAAAELRRLHEKNQRLAAEVANRNRRALAGDEAVAALANVHSHYEGLEAQRDALLEALKYLDKEFRQHGRQHWPEAVRVAAAIRACNP